MNKTTIGCKELLGAISIWLAVAGGAQAGVFILDDPYLPGEQLVLEINGCRPDGPLEKLFPLLKQRQTPASPIMLAAPAAVASPVRTAITPPVRTVHLSQALMIGVGF